MELQRRGDSEVLEVFMETRTIEPDEQSCTSCEELQRVQPLPLDKKGVGGREKVLLTDLGIVHEARIETGATTSSLDARDGEVFERDGEQWVRVKIINPESDEPVELERKRVRRGLIAAGETAGPGHRPVS